MSLCSISTLWATRSSLKHALPVSIDIYDGRLVNQMLLEQGFFFPITGSDRNILILRVSRLHSGTRVHERVIRGFTGPWCNKGAWIRKFQAPGVAREPGSGGSRPLVQRGSLNLEDPGP